MIFYFADRSYEMIGQASTDLKEGMFIDEDWRDEDIDSGTASMEFRLYFEEVQRSEAEQIVETGNYILCHRGNKDEFYTITETDIDTSDGFISVYAEDAGLNLLNTVAEPYAAEEAIPIADYMNHFITGSGFEIGFNEISGFQRQLSWDSDSTVAERVRSIATQFDAEMDYSFEVDGFDVLHMYINIYRQRGVNIHKMLYLGKDVKRILKKKSINELATALKPKGGFLEDGESRLTLENAEYDDDDIYLSNGILYSRSAGAIWNPNHSLSESSYIVRTVEYETASVSRLLEQSVARLKAIARQTISYDIELSEYLNDVSTGDTVTVIDTAGDTYLEARATHTRCSAALEEKILTLGDYTSASASKLNRVINAIGSQISGQISNQVSGSIPAIEQSLAEELARQTRMIVGAEGGSVVFGFNENGYPNEIMFLDTEDIETAKHYIRINHEGIGFGTLGIDADFTTAWTIDGSLSANYIRTGTLEGGLIKAGSVQTESLTVDAKDAVDGSVLRFHFDEYGLHIGERQKDANDKYYISSEYNSLFSNNGMRVIETQSGKPTLIAEKDTVTAENLTANQYLRVKAENVSSRFQQFYSSVHDENEFGVFWEV